MRVIRERRRCLRLRKHVIHLNHNWMDRCISTLNLHPNPAYTQGIYLSTPTHDNPCKVTPIVPIYGTFHPNHPTTSSPPSSSLPLHQSIHPSNQPPLNNQPTRPNPTVPTPTPLSQTPTPRPRTRTPNPAPSPPRPRQAPAQPDTAPQAPRR